MSGQEEEQLTLFPEGFRVSPSVWPESREGKKTSGICGPKCSGLSGSCARIASSVRTYLESSALPPGRWSRTWSRQAITPSCSILKLRLSERGTDGQGSFSSASQMWPTPTAGQCGMTARTSNRPIEKSTKLGTQVYVRSGLAPMVATPLARDYRTGQRKRFGNPLRSKNLNDQIGGQLNPMWVEWLMGFPIGWTDLSVSETP